MDQEDANDSAIAPKTKGLEWRPTLKLQTDTHDIMDTFKGAGISSRVAENEGHATPELSSIISPVSSTDTFVTASSSDTFVTALESANSKEDRSSTEHAPTSTGSASQASTDSEVKITSTLATAASDIEDAKRNSKIWVANKLANISLESVGAQHTHATSANLATKRQSDLEPTALLLNESHHSQHSQETTPTTAPRPKDRLSTQTSNPEHTIPALPTRPQDKMTGHKKKLTQRQARRERSLDVLSSIDEEDGGERSTTRQDPSEDIAVDEKAFQDLSINEESSHATATNTSTAKSKRKIASTTQSETKIDKLRKCQTPTKSTSTTTSTQAINATGIRVAKDPLHGSLVGPASKPGQMVANILSQPWLFTYDQPHKMTNCWLPTCGRPTTSSDGRTVVCPRCGDRSYVRYCSVTHLLADMKDHYSAVCGKRGNLLHIDETTITPTRQASRDFIPVAVEDHGSAERHRQALYHAYPPESDITTSTRLPADYYIFSDADRFDVTGLPCTVENLSFYRCTGTIAGRVRYQQTDPRKVLFVTLLERLLVLGQSAGKENAKGCRLLFMWIKENLVGQEEWTNFMITRMCLAMQMEFGWSVDEDLRE